MVKEFGLYANISVAHPTPVEEESCPTCGSLPRTVTPDPVWRSVDHPRWPWVFLALAAFLFVAFGAPAWSDYQNADNALGMLRGTEDLRPGVVPDPLHFTLVNVKASATPWETYVPTRQQLDRDVIASALGIMAALVGLGALARGAQLPDYSTSLPENGGGRASTGAAVSALLLTGWEFGESLALSAFRVLLVAFCYVATGELLQGGQLSWDRVGDTTNRTLDVIVSVQQLLR